MSATVRLALALVAITLLPSAAHAQTSWTNGGANGIWENDANWTGGTAGNFPGDTNTDSARFGVTDNPGQDDCSLTSARNITNLTLHDSGAGWNATVSLDAAVTLTLSGNITWTHTAGSPASNLSLTVSNAVIDVAGNITWSDGTLSLVAGSSLQIGGSFTIEGAGAISNAGTLLFDTATNTTLSDTRMVKTSLGNITLDKTDSDTFTINNPIIVDDLLLAQGAYSSSNNAVTVQGDLIIDTPSGNTNDLSVADGTGDEFVLTGVGTWSMDIDESIGDVRIASGAIITLGSDVRADVVTVEAGGILVLAGNALNRNTLNNSGIVITGTSNVLRWTAGAAGTWATTANWTNAVTGAPAASFPVAGDVAIFDRAASNIDCTIGADAAAAALLMKSGNTDALAFGGNFSLTLTNKAQLFGDSVSLAGTTGLLSCTTLELNGGALALGDGRTVGAESNVSVQVSTSLLVTSGTLTIDSDNTSGVGGILLDATANALDIVDTSGGTNLGRVIHIGGNDVRLGTATAPNNVTVASWRGSTNNTGQLDLNDRTLTITGDAAGNGLVMRNNDILTATAAANPDFIFTGTTGAMSWSATTTSEDFLQVRITSVTNPVTLGSNVTIGAALDLQGRLNLGTSRTLSGAVTCTTNDARIEGTGTIGGAIAVTNGTTRVTGTIAQAAGFDVNVNGGTFEVDTGSFTSNGGNGDVFSVLGSAALTISNGGTLSLCDDFTYSSTGAFTIGANCRFLFGDDWTAFGGTLTNNGTIETRTSASTDGSYDLAPVAGLNYGRVIHAVASDDLRLTANSTFTSYEQNSTPGFTFNNVTLTISGGGSTGGFVVDSGALTFGTAATDLRFTGTSVWDDDTGTNVYDDVSVDATATVSMRLRLPHGAVAGGSFAVGNTVTGGTSGATAVISEVGAGFVEVITVAAGATQTFQNGETISNGLGQSAALSGAGSGTLNITDGSIAGTLNLNGTLFDVAGTLTLTGTLRTQDGGELEVSSGGTITTTAGTINAAGSTIGGLVDLDVSFANTNTGTITLGAGDMALNGATYNFTGATVTSSAGSTVTFELTCAFAADNDADADTFTGITVNGGQTVTLTGTLNVNGLLDVNGTFDATGDTINAAGDIDETGGTLTMTSASTLNLQGAAATQTITINTSLTLGTVSINHALPGLETDQVILTGGAVTADNITITRGTLVPQSNLTVSTTGTTALIIQDEGNFASSTDGLTLLFTNAGGTGNVMVLNNAATFSVSDPTNNATQVFVRIDAGTTVDLNGSAVFTLAGQTSGLLMFESDTNSSPFTVNAETGVTVSVSNAAVEDSNGGGGPQSPLIATGASTLNRTTNWLVGRLWVGGSGTSWNTPANWQGNAVPGATDAAIFTAASRTNAPPDTLGGLATIGGILVTSGFDGGTLGTLPIVIDGSLTLNGNLTYTPSNLGPTSKLDLTGAATVTVTGNVSVDRTLGDGNGTLVMTGSTPTLTPGANTATLDLRLQVGNGTETNVTMSGTNALTVSDLYIEDAVSGGNNGALSTGAGPAPLNLTGPVTVENTGVLTAGTSTINFSGATWSSGGGVTHTGAFNFTGGTQGFTPASGDTFGAMSVNGTVAANVTFNSPVTATSLDVTSGDTLTSSSNITLAGNLTSAGGLTHSGGTVFFTANATITAGGDTLNALTIQNSAVVGTAGGNLAVTGAVTVNGTDSCALTMGTGHALSASSLVVTRGTITLNGTGGGTIGTGGISFGGTGTRALTLAGTVNLSGTIDTTPNDASSFSHSGTLSLTGPLTIERSTNVNAFATLTSASGTVTLGGSGAVAVTTVNVTSGLLELSGTGTVTATTVNVNGGVLDMNVGTSFGTTTVANGATLRNDDTDNLTHAFGTGDIAIADGGSFLIGTGLATGAESVTLSFADTCIVDVGSGGVATFRVQSAGANFHTLQATTGWVFNADSVGANLTFSRVTIRNGDASGSAAQVPVSNGFNATPSTNVNWSFGTKTTTWTGGGGAGNTDWSHVQNWDNGPPNDSTTGDAVVFSSVAVATASTQNINAGGLDGLTLASLTMNTNYTGTLTLTNRITVLGAATLNGTVNLSANPWSSASLTINTGSTLQGGGAATVSTGAFTMNGTATYTEGTGNTTVTGDVTIASTATWTNNTGILVFAAPSPALNTPGTQSWSGSGVGANGVGEVQINNGDADPNEGVLVTLTGNATVVSLVVDGNDRLTLNAGRTLSTTAAGSVTLNGTAVLTVTAGGGATNALDVHDLTLNGDSVYNESSQRTRVTGDLSIASTASWVDGTGVLTFDANVDQNWTGSGDQTNGVGEVSVIGTNGRIEILSAVTLTVMDVGTTKTVDANANQVTLRGAVGDNTPLAIAGTGSYVSTGLTEFASTNTIQIPTLLASYGAVTLSGGGDNSLEATGESISGALTLTGDTLTVGALFTFQANGITGTGTLDATGATNVTTTGAMDVANFTPGVLLTFAGGGSGGSWGSATVPTYGAVSFTGGTFSAGQDIVVSSLISSGGSLAMGGNDLTTSGTVDLVGLAFTQGAAGATNLTSGALQTFQTDGDTVGILNLNGGTDVTLTGALVTAGPVNLTANSILSVPASTGIDIAGLLTIPSLAAVNIDASSAFRGGVSVSGTFTADTGPIALTFGNASTFVANTGGQITIDDVATNQITIQGVTSGGAQWSFNYQTGTVTHGAVTNGPFQVNERIIGQTSGAQAFITAVGVGSVSVGHARGTFQAGEVITGQTSTAQATVGTFTPANVVVADVLVRDSAAQHRTIPGLASGNINLGNNTNWFDLNDLNAVWLGTVDNDWDDTGNWQGGALPTNGSNIVIDATAPVGPQDNFASLPGTVTNLGGLSIPNAWAPAGGATAETVRFNGTVNIGGSCAIGTGSTVDVETANFTASSVTGGGTLDVSAATTVTINAELSVTTYIKPTSGTLTITGNWSGTSNFGTVVLGGAVIPGSDLVMDGLNINGQTFVLGAGNDIDVGTGGITDPAATGTLDATGALVETQGGLTIGTYVPGTQLEFDGTGNWDQNNTTNFGTVLISLGTVTQLDGIVAGALTIGGGTLDTNAAFNYGLRATSITVSTGSLAGNSSIVEPLTSLNTTGAGTVTLNAAGQLLFNAATATITADAGDSLGILRLQGASNVSLVGTVTVGSVDVQAGTLSAGTSILQVNTTWSVTAGATFAPGTGRVEFVTAAAHSIAGGAQFHDLTVVAGAMTPPSGLTVLRDLTCTGTWNEVGTLSVQRHWSFTAPGAFVRNGGAVQFNGGVTQNITHGTSGEFWVVRIQNGTTLVQQNAVTVFAQLQVQSGVLNQNGQSMIFNGVNVTQFPISVTSGTGSINGNNGTIDLNVNNDGLGSLVQLVSPGLPGYHNVTLDSSGTTAHTYTSSGGAFTCTGALSIDSAPVLNTFQMGGNVTVGSLTGSGLFNMAALSFTLELTGSVSPLGIVPSNATNGIIKYNSTGAAATVNTSFTYSNLELAGGGKSYPWAGTLSVSANLTLTGGANFATTTQNITFTGGTNGSFRGNASTYTVGTLTINKTVGAFVTMLGTAGGTRTITTLTHTSGVLNIDCNLRIVDATIGVAGSPGTNADFRFDASNTTLTLGAPTGTHFFDIFDRVQIGGQQPDVTLVLSGDGTLANLTSLRLRDDFCDVALRGNPVGSGTVPNLTIKASTTDLASPLFQPRFLDSGTTIGRQTNGSFDVQNVDVQDNDCTGITFGNTNGAGTYTGAGIQATASSQLNANTPGWIFVGGGSISGQIGEALSNSSGAIDVVRIYFNGAGDLNPATLGTVHERFTLIQTDAFGNEVTRIQGTAADIPVGTQLLEVEFGNGVGQTHIQGLRVVYDAPTSGFLRNEVGTPASIDFTLTPGGTPELVDGAAPILLSSFFQDSDQNGGLDRASFFFSEPMSLSAGCGWMASGFRPTTNTSDMGSSVSLQLVIAGETLAPIQLDFNGNQLTGADIAAEIQRQVREVMAENPPGSSIVSVGGHSPLNRPAFMNFTCTYSEADERYLFKAGVPLRWDGTAGEYVQDFTLSTVDVVLGGANDAAPFLKLGTVNGGSGAPGYGTARGGLSVSGNIATPAALAGTTLTGSINGEPSGDITIGGAANTLVLVAQFLEAVIRDEALTPPALDANRTAYAEFVVVPDNTNVSGLANRLIFIAGGQGSASRVVVDSSSSFAVVAQMGAGEGEQTTVVAVDDVSGSLGGTHFLLDTPSSQYYVWLDVDNGSPDPSVVGRLGVQVDIRMDDTADLVADALAAALDALPDLEATVSGSPDQVVVTATAPGDVADATDAGGTGFTITAVSGFVYPNAVETRGRENTTTSLEDVLITSALGQNLLLGGTAADLVVSGSAVTIDLANQAGSGTGTPRYVVGDRNGNGGFFADASGWNNQSAAFANVPASDGVVVQGDTNGDGRVEVAPGTNIRVDASNVVMPGGTLGVSVTYQWTLVSAPGDRETTTVITRADAFGDLNNTFFLLSARSVDYYVWFDVAGAGVDPVGTNPGLATRTGVQVAINTNDPATSVATALAAALDPLGDFEAVVDTINTDWVTVTNALPGDVTDATDGAGATGFVFTNTDGSGGIVITSDTTSILDFGASLAGSYEWLLTLTVRDASGAPVAVPGYTDNNGQVGATVFVDVQEVAPVADAGGDQVVIGASVTLDGSGSFDPNGGVSSFTYAWTATDPNGNVVAAGSFTGGSGGTPQSSPDPTFSPGVSGVYTVTLTVAKTSNPALTDSHSIRVVVNDPSDLLPVADAGDPQVGRVGSVVTLHGNASVDPEGTALTYQWDTVTSPEAVTLSDDNAVEPTFIPNLPGSYVFELTVTDAGGLRGPSTTVTVQVADDLGADVRRPPAAHARAAGLEQAVFLASAPANLGNSAFVLADGSSVATTIVDDAADLADDPAPGTTNGLARVQVLVNGALEATLYTALDRDQVGLVALRFQDGSTAVVERFGRVGSSFVLDGSLSQDDGAVTAFLWAQSGGPYRFDTMSGNLVAVVPQTAGTYVFELVVTDNIGLRSLAATLSVPVLPAAAVNAGPPTAVAAGGSGTTALGGVLTSAVGNITLDAGESTSLATGTPTSGGAALTYLWEQVSGATTAFSDPTLETPTVDLPIGGPYAFRVTVTDVNGVSDSAVVWVSAHAPAVDAPVAIVGAVPTQTLSQGGAVTVSLNAGQSDGVAPLTFQWGQRAGVPFAVEASGSSGSVTIDQPGTYTFLVRAVGADGSVSPPAEVTFVVNSSGETPLVSGGVVKESKGGCALAAPREGPSSFSGGLLLALVGLALWAGRRGGRA